MEKGGRGREIRKTEREQRRENINTGGRDEIMREGNEERIGRENGKERQEREG